MFVFGSFKIIELQYILCPSGGYHSGYFYSVEIFDIQSATFSMENPMPVALYNHCVVWQESTSMVYIISGASLGDTFQTATYSYDIQTGVYQILTGSLNVPRVRMECKIMEDVGKIIIAGGLHSSWGPVTGAVVEILDIASQTWSQGQGVPWTGLMTFSKLDNTLVAFGPLSTDVYLYDIDNGQWDQMRGSAYGGGFAGTEPVTSLGIKVKDLPNCNFIF